MIPLGQPSTPRRRVSLRIDTNSVGAMLWRNRVCAPIRAVIHIREVLPHHGERDLLYVRAVGVGRVDTLAAIDEHAENDPSAIRRPSGPECEIWSGNLQIDVGVTASVRVDREYLSVPQFPDNLCPLPP